MGQVFAAVGAVSVGGISKPLVGCRADDWRMDQPYRRIARFGRIDGMTAGDKPAALHKVIAFFQLGNKFRNILDGILIVAVNGQHALIAKGQGNFETMCGCGLPVVYLFFMILGQMGTALTAWLAFEYEWKYVYYFMMGILLLSILILFITMPNHGFAGRFPINFRKFGNVTAFCISLTCITYVLVYGKVLDWYDDPSICWATAISILFAGIFLYMDVTRRSSYFILGALRLRTIRMGALLYLLLMIINSSAMFVNVYAGVGMHLDNLQNASLANWCMVGYFIGALISIVLGSKGVHLKYLFALGFFFLALSAGFMYFEVQTAGLYERMKYPVIIRTIGMMILYALTAAYANQRMPFKYLSTWICIMLTVRMVLGPGIGGAIYSNVLQERQQHYITRYAQNVDLVNPEASASYTNTVQGMQYQGKSETEAHNMAAMSVKGRIQVQATLSAVKEMAGWTIYAGVICMIFVLVVPYPKRKLLT